jgi:hypothetical protein
VLPDGYLEIISSFIFFDRKNSTKLLSIFPHLGEDCKPWMIGAIAHRILREAQVPVILMREGSAGSLTERYPPKCVGKIRGSAVAGPGLPGYSQHVMYRRVT